MRLFYYIKMPKIVNPGTIIFLIKRHCCAKLNSNKVLAVLLRIKLIYKIMLSMIKIYLDSFSKITLGIFHFSASFIIISHEYHLAR